MLGRQFQVGGLVCSLPLSLLCQYYYLVCARLQAWVCLGTPISEWFPCKLRGYWALDHRDGGQRGPTVGFGVSWGKCFETCVTLGSLPFFVSPTCVASLPGSSRTSRSAFCSTPVAPLCQCPKCSGFSPQWTLGMGSGMCDDCRDMCHVPPSPNGCPKQNMPHHQSVACVLGCPAPTCVRTAANFASHIMQSFVYYT